MNRVIFFMLACLNCFFVQANPNPQKFQGLPRADDQGIVVAIKRLNIQGAQYLSNGCLIKDNQEAAYQLFFHHDDRKPGNKTLNRNFISRIKLNEQFQQISEVLNIDTKNNYSEDPRVFCLNDEFFLIYNAPFEDDKRKIFVAKIDPETCEVLEYDPLLSKDPPFLKWEKNWVPFIAYDQEENSSLMFEYNIYPRKIVKMMSASHSLVEFFKEDNQKMTIPWPWISLGGANFQPGTCGYEIENGLCLGFFHTTFSETSFKYTVIGAYTFENKAPFKIQSMSPYPIIFKDMYAGPLLTDRQYSIFPTGYVMENVDGVDLLHLSCGINEMSIDIITFDKNNLIESLIPITYTCPIYEDKK